MNFIYYPIKFEIPDMIADLSAKQKISINSSKKQVHLLEAHSMSSTRAELSKLEFDGILDWIIHSTKSQKFGNHSIKFLSRSYNYLHSW